MKHRLLLWLPLAAFVAVLALVASGLLHPADRTVRSKMIGAAVPSFDLPAIAPGKPGLTAAAMRDGKPHLLNIFASWCVPCAAEAPQLMQLRQAGVTIDAIAVRDTGPAIAGFLARYGDPYARMGDDHASQVQLSLGSSGVPESFVVDGRGRIVLQHVGEIRPEDVSDILAAVRDAS